MKILIISHNCVDTFNNMGKTLKSLFQAFKKEELCQLYIYPTIPNVDICNSYFRVTDLDVLKAHFTFKVKGKIIDKTEIRDSNELFENEEIKKKYRNNDKKTFLKKKLRDFLWGTSNWFNKDLKRWLDNEKPTHIFVAPGEKNFFYNIAFKCSNYLNIPIVTYICDDYYFINQKNKFWDRMYQKKLKRNIEKLINKSSEIITICNELSQSYSKRFNRRCSIIMTGIDLKNKIENLCIDDIKTFSFFGNISKKRYLNIYDIGTAIDNINKKYKKDLKLTLYTDNTDEEIIKLLKRVNAIEYHQFVIGDEYAKALRNTDIFIHTESFDSKYSDLVKHSISTKIPECLNSGKLLLAYGPDSVASINYLKNNKCAFVITKKDDLEEKLYEIITDNKLRKEIINAALKIGRENHDSMKNSERLHNIIEDI